MPATSSQRGFARPSPYPSPHVSHPLHTVLCLWLSREAARTEVLMCSGAPVKIGRS
jgi:hypothetical protein